jgi:hypothetical protein
MAVGEVPVDAGMEGEEGDEADKVLANPGPAKPATSIQRCGILSDLARGLKISGLGWS